MKSLQSTSIRPMTPYAARPRAAVRRHRCGGLMVLLLTLGLLLALVGPTQAAPLIFSRGLPVYNATAPNLNQSALPNTSNTALGQNFPDSVPPSNYLVPGDDWTIGVAGQTYHIETVRLWMNWGQQPGEPNCGQYDTSYPYSAPTNLKLWVGPAGGAIAPQSTNFIATRVWYSDGENFQTVDSKWHPMWQIDFVVKADFQGGQRYQFFLDGLNQNLWTYGWQTGPLLGSNAALSNAPQEGADGKMFLMEINNGTPGNISTINSIYFGTSGGVIYNKAPDGDVQIFGNIVNKSGSAPSLYLLLLLED
jgi:hypothetical protein